ncbi:MAG: hypothetical protein IBJ00_04365 [Alphaproteobacteria bacterium]|nr:hypothetical protein [Alphaproteobacteria bacterium]
MKKLSFLVYRLLILLVLIPNTVDWVHSSSSWRRDASEIDSTPLYARRLSSDQDHTTFLIDTLNSAQETVMISSYSVSLQRLTDEGIGDAIMEAAARGVKVYIYYENRLLYPPKEYAILRHIESSCARFEDITIHAKCVLKDKETVAIGSYNWLSDSREGSVNGTIVASGLLASGLIKDVWQGIRFYQSQKYENDKGIEKFLSDTDAFSTGAYQFAPKQFLYTLRTSEAHGLFLNDVFENAQERVLLLSPFIRLAKLQETFTPKLLQNLRRKGVSLTLITLPSPCDKIPHEQREIFTSLNRLKSMASNFSYITHPNLHAKTLIADQDVICESSFNWLSAVSETFHIANNFEMSVAVRGNIGQNLIKAFSLTPLGKSLEEINLKEKEYPPLEGTQASSTYGKRPNREATKITSKREVAPSSLKKQRSVSTKSSSNSNTGFKIFSGEKFQIEGYCVRYNNGEYLKDYQNKTIYFKTRKQAEQAANHSLPTVKVIPSESYKGIDSDSAIQCIGSSDQSSSGSTDALQSSQNNFNPTRRAPGSYEGVKLPEKEEKKPVPGDCVIS